MTPALLHLRRRLFRQGLRRGAIAGDAHRSPARRARRRNSSALRAAGIEPFVFDGETHLGRDVRAALAETTHLIVSIAPDEAGDPVLRCRRATISPAACRTLRWIGYLSTVGVYGDHGGAWVDETSECRPVSRRSVLRVAAEQDWLALGARDAACRLRSCGFPASTGRAATPSSTSPNGTAQAPGQAGPGVQPHPCRRHRRRALASGASADSAASSTSPTTCRRRRRTSSPMRPS